MTYKCCFGDTIFSSTSIKSKIKCQSFIKFVRNFNFIHFVDGNFHHNHPSSKFFTQCNKNCLTDEELKDLKIKGLRTPQIRRITNNSLPSKILYILTRKIAEELNSDQMVSLKNEINTWKDWKVIYNYISTQNEKKIDSITLINNYVAFSNYGNDLVVIDDTACVNIFGMDIEAVIAVDENGNSQLLAFSFLSTKTIQDFSNFFQNIKNRCNYNIRVCVMDRCKAQLSALLSVYPDIKYVFCREHLLLNFEKQFDIKSAIYSSFFNLVRHNNEEDFFFNCFEYYETTTKSSRDFIDSVLKIRGHWQQSIIKKFAIYDNYTSNRAETFFGCLKTQTDHNFLTLKDICLTIRRLSDSARRNNKIARYSINNLPSFVIDNEVLKRLLKLWD